MNRKEIVMICLYNNHSTFHHVANDINGYEMSMYERKTTMNNASIIKRLVNLEWQDASSMIEHQCIHCHINQLSSVWEADFEDGEE